MRLWGGDQLLSEWLSNRSSYVQLHAKALNVICNQVHSRRHAKAMFVWMELHTDYILLFYVQAVHMKDPA